MRKDKDHLDLEHDSGLEQELEGITFTYDDTGLSSGSNETQSESDLEKYYRRGGTKKRKKRKKKRYLLKFCIFLLVVAAGILFLRSQVFDIKAISVGNNAYYTKEQVIELAQVKIGDNLFEFTMGSREKKLMTDPYIKTAEVKRKLPGGLDIMVNERVEKIVIPYENKYIVADYEGMILRVSDQAPDLTVITNLNPEKPKPGTPLEVKETRILTDTLNLLKDVEKADLYFKKVAVSAHSVDAYIYDSLIVQGSYDNIIGDLDHLSMVMEDVNKKKTKRGIIKVSGNGHITVQPEVDTKKP